MAQDSLIIRQLPEVSVSAQLKIDTLSDETYSVIEYFFLEKGILLLGYKNIFAKYELIWLDEKLKVRDRNDLQHKGSARLIKNCLGEIYLITETVDYQIEVDQAIHLKKSKPVDLSSELVNSCAWTTDNFMYFSQYYFQGQALEYCAIPRSKSKFPYTLPLIQDERNIQLLIEETGNRMPRSEDVWQENVSDGLEDLRGTDYRLRGMMKIFYPKLYIPIFSKDSILYLFNHLESRLQLFNESGKHISEIAIDYHQHKKWKKEILYDRFHQKAYTTFDTRWGENICQVSLEDGSLGPMIPIDRPFIKKRKINKGFLYFLYQDPYSSGKNRQLQRVRIN